MCLFAALNAGAFVGKVHSQLRPSMDSYWVQIAQMYEIRGAIDRASLIDVVLFVALADRTRRSSKKRWGALAMEMIATLTNSPAVFLGQCIRNEAIRICSHVPELDSRQVPSRKSLRSPPNIPVPYNSLVPFDPNNEDDTEHPVTRSRKSKVTVDLNSIWELYQDSMDSGVSLPELARTRRKDRAAGMSEGSVHYWMRKIESIYAKRSSMSVSDCRFFNIACDASRHSTRDTLVSIVYAMENQVGVYANAQVMKSGGKLLAPDEAVLDEEIEHLAAIREIDRLASYRLMQAISYQLKFLASKTLSSFLLDEGDPLALALKPLTPDMVRVVKKSETGQVTVYLHDKVARTTTPLDLSGATSKPILNLIMDQGRCGTAFAGYLAGAGRCNLIHYGFLTWLVICLLFFGG